MAPDFASARMIVDFPTERVGHELMSIADAKERHPDFNGIANPLRRGLAPGVKVCDHRPRAGYDRDTSGIGPGERFAIEDADDLYRFSGPFEHATEPVRKIAEASPNFVWGCTDLNNE